MKEIKVLIPSLEKQNSIITNWEKRKGKIITNQKETIKLLQEENKDILDKLWEVNH